MKIYEKALEKYYKYIKELHEYKAKEDFEAFAKLVQRMVDTGECIAVSCEFCPERIFYECYPEKCKGCGVTENSERRERMQMEYIENADEEV